VNFTDEQKRRMQDEQHEQFRRYVQKGPIVFKLARGCRSGCGCLISFFFFVIFVAIVVSLVLMFTGGDSPGKRACERFYELGNDTSGLTLSGVALGSELNDIQELSSLAEADIRVASDALFVAAQPVEVDTVALVTAAAALGAACAEAGHSP
jgi:hypothetical protein